MAFSMPTSVGHLHCSTPLCMKGNNYLSRYAEGIDVLFYTSTLHIGSSDLLEHLPRLFLPQRLYSIQSVEMLWFKRPKPNHPSYICPMEVLWNDPTRTESPPHTLCQMIPQALPSIRQLNISLECSLNTPHPFQDPPSTINYGHIALGTIEDMLRVLGPMREFNVTVPWTTWHDQAEKCGRLYGPKLRIERYNWLEGRFWKLLGGPGDELGYWVCCGHYDNPLWRHYCCTAF